MKGIYIHIPFCVRKCPYCAFYSGPGDEEKRESYVSALIRNIRAARRDSFGTVYFGGGTPTVLTPDQLGRVLEACRESFVLREPEITVEANPGTVDTEKLRALREAGFNRISFGVQSLDPRETALLGRLHTPAQAEEAILAAEKAGFGNISADLMLGTPGQTEETLAKTLARFVSLPLSHVSAYMLSVEEGTPFAARGVRPAGEELMCRLYDLCADTLERAGFEHYEVSNFARPGRRSRHNVNYWQGGEYMGFGAGAHSFYGGERYFCPEDTEEFIRRKVQGKTVTDSAPDRAEEYVMLRLRLREGIDLDEAAGLCGEAAARRLREKGRSFLPQGLTRFEGSRLSLTRAGWLLSNALIAELIDCL